MMASRRIEDSGSIRLASSAPEASASAGKSGSIDATPVPQVIVSLTRSQTNAAWSSEARMRSVGRWLGDVTDASWLRRRSAHTAARVILNKLVHVPEHFRKRAVFGHNH